MPYFSFSLAISSRNWLLSRKSTDIPNSDMRSRTLGCPVIFAHGFFDASNDARWYFGRRSDTVKEVDIESRHSAFGHARHLWHQREPSLCRNAQWLHFPLLDKRHDGYRQRPDERDLSA